MYKVIGIEESVYNAVYGPYKGSYTFSIVPTLIRPKSRGWIRLNSTSPYEHPIINPNYFADDQDMKVLIEGMKIAINVSSTAPFLRYNATLFTTKFPGCKAFEIYSDEYLRCAINMFTFTIWHFSGTYKMGSENDTSAVVDPQLRVKGVEGLRVVDASIMPTVISGNINAPTIAIAEKIADLMKGVRIIPFLPPMNQTMIDHLPDLPTEELDEIVF